MFVPLNTLLFYAMMSSIGDAYSGRNGGRRRRDAAGLSSGMDAVRESILSVCVAASVFWVICFCSETDPVRFFQHFQSFIKISSFFFNLLSLDNPDQSRIYTKKYTRLSKKKTA